MQVNYGKVFRIGRLDDDYKFIAEPIQTTPLEPEMKAVYYDTREREPMDQVYYVAGIMDQALGYFSTEEMIPMQAYFGAEMARQRED
jgi:hypothetical protein